MLQPEGTTVQGEIAIGLLALQPWRPKECAQPWRPEECSWPTYWHFVCPRGSSQHSFPCFFMVKAPRLVRMSSVPSPHAWRFWQTWTTQRQRFSSTGSDHSAAGTHGLQCRRADADRPSPPRNISPRFADGWPPCHHPSQRT